MSVNVQDGSAESGADAVGSCAKAEVGFLQKAQGNRGPHRKQKSCQRMYIIYIYMYIHTFSTRKEINVYVYRRTCMCKCV